MDIVAPNFSIIDHNTGQKVETLKACFMGVAVFKRSNLPSTLCADDGIVYTTVYDCRIPKNVGEIETVISFQQHTYGNFAVIRLKREKK